MRAIISLYRYVNILSLDVAAGAMVCGVFFSRLLNASLLPYSVIVLGLTVWVIYTADHLRDARQIGGEASSARHSFHFSHSRGLWAILVAAVFVDGIIVLLMRKPIIAAGLMLLPVVVIYLLAHRHLGWAKEMFVAALYTCGVLLPSVSVSSPKLEWQHYVAFAIFALLALINLLVLSWFDYPNDVKDRQSSFATTMGRDVTRLMVFILVTLNYAGLTLLFFAGFDPGAIIVLSLMNTLLLVIFLFPGMSERNNRYRMIGDAVFLLPAIYLL